MSGSNCFEYWYSRSHSFTDRTSDRSPPGTHDFCRNIPILFGTGGPGGGRRWRYRNMSRSYLYPRLNTNGTSTPAPATPFGFYLS